MAVGISPTALDRIERNDQDPVKARALTGSLTYVKMYDHRCSPELCSERVRHLRVYKTHEVLRSWAA